MLKPHDDPAGFRGHVIHIDHFERRDREDYLVDDNTVHCDVCCVWGGGGTRHRFCGVRNSAQLGACIMEKLQQGFLLLVLLPVAGLRTPQPMTAMFLLLALGVHETVKLEPQAACRPRLFRSCDIPLDLLPFHTAGQHPRIVRKPGRIGCTVHVPVIKPAYEVFIGFYFDRILIRFLIFWRRNNFEQHLTSAQSRTQ